MTVYFVLTALAALTIILIILWLTVAIRDIRDDAFERSVNRLLAVIHATAQETHLTPLYVCTEMADAYLNNGKRVPLELLVVQERLAHEYLHTSQA